VRRAISTRAGIAFRRLPTFDGRVPGRRQHYRHFTAARTLREVRPVPSSFCRSSRQASR
jgi:hypothetical protein